MGVQGMTTFEAQRLLSSMLKRKKELLENAEKNVQRLSLFDPRATERLKHLQEALAAIDKASDALQRIELSPQTMKSPQQQGG